MDFELKSPFSPTGDQPQAIEALCKAYNLHKKEQTLLGVTGSGKTFTMANVISNLKMPTLILSHNKTLAGQLYAEFKAFFPNNAVEYFISYYDYYQPEAYVASTDTYIQKDASINKEIERLRHSATASLFERKDVIVVSSVSCIYGLGNPENYEKMALSLRKDMQISIDDVAKGLTKIQFTRNDVQLENSRFRIKGDTIDIVPASKDENAIRLVFFGDTIEHIYEIEILTGKKISERTHILLYPASHYTISSDKIESAITRIEEELQTQIKYFKDQNLLVEAQRIKERTMYDIEMLRQVGYCNGIENYARILENREPGSPPYTLMDYFPKDFLMIIDESHITLSQVRGMFAGDYARKSNLVRFGFRLPSAIDNRPLNFEEFQERTDRLLYVSATPSEYEIKRSGSVTEQIIRPTGILDPIVEVKSTKGQMDDLYSEIQKTVSNGERVFVTVLTKVMAEELSTYLKNLGVKAMYIHSTITALERMQIIRELRLGVYDVLVGINLLREGLDVPEVSLVAILDADQEGFLRSAVSLIQTIGRAARNANSKVILYADTITKSMKQAIDETARRRAIQEKYNLEHGIVPKNIKKDIRSSISTAIPEEDNKNKKLGKKESTKILSKSVEKEIARLEKQMAMYSKNMLFEEAIEIREQIYKLSMGKKGVKKTNK